MTRTPERRAKPARRAGRPRGSGPYGEPTRALRVPQSLVPELQAWLARYRVRDGRLPPGARAPHPNPEPLALPLFGSRISAGFPSPADDYVEDMLDLQKLLVEHPAATFYLRVTGDSMSGAGILSGDILVVDRALEPAHDAIVVASVDGELTVKRLYHRNGWVALVAENPAYAPIEIDEAMDMRIWGVVCGVVRKF